MKLNRVLLLWPPFETKPTIVPPTVIRRAPSQTDTVIRRAPPQTDTVIRRAPS